MFDIQPIEIDVPSLLAPQDEVVSVVHEYKLGHALREVSLFRVWRIWRDSLHTQIYDIDENGEMAHPMFGTFNLLIEFLVENIDVSRSKIYSRLRAYSLLAHLEYSEAQMVRMMGTRPGLYDRALNLIFVWDQESRAPTEMRTDIFGRNPFDAQTKQNVRNFIAELEQTDRIGDALSRLIHDILGKPMLKVRFDKSLPALHVSFSSTSIDAETGNEIINDRGDVVFEATSELPEWVASELQAKYPLY